MRTCTGFSVMTSANISDPFFCSCFPNIFLLCIFKLQPMFSLQFFWLLTFVAVATLKSCSCFVPYAGWLFGGMWEIAMSACSDQS